MTLDELRAEAKKHGYRLAKVPPYTCMCLCPYPRNERCAERYEPVPSKGQYTHCRKKEKNDEQNSTS